MKTAYKLPQHVVDKGLQIVNHLKAGICYTQYKGKRMLKVDRQLVSIKLNDTSRLLYHIMTREFYILTHQDYNKFLGCKRG